MTEYFRAIGWPYPKLVAEGTDPSVINANLSFRSPAYFDDLIEADVTCTKVGTSSFQLDVCITRDQTELATIELIYVNVDATKAQSRPLPAAVAQTLRRYIRTS